MPQVRQVLRFAQDDKREARLAGKRHKMLRHPFVKQAEAELTVSHRFQHALADSLAGDVSIESIHEGETGGAAKPTRCRPERRDD